MKLRNLFLTTLTCTVIGILMSVPYAVVDKILQNQGNGTPLITIDLFILNGISIGPYAIYALFVGVFYAFAYKSFDRKTIAQKLSVRYLIGLGVAYWVTYGRPLDGQGDASMGWILLIPFIIPIPALAMVLSHTMVGDIQKIRDRFRSDNNNSTNTSQ